MVQTLRKMNWYTSNTTQSHSNFLAVEREPMNEQMMAEQLKNSGNLMDLTFSQEWLEEAAEDDGWVEAGVTVLPYHNYLKSLTQEQHRCLRVRAQLASILLPELRQWVETWGLGLSFESVHTAARAILYRHLTQLIEEKGEWVTALVDEDSQHLPMEERAVRSQSISVLSQLFTKMDWNELAEVAAQEMSQTVMKVQRSVSEKLPATA